MFFWIQFSPIGHAVSSSKKPLSFREKIVTFWSAPITKFYVNFASYLVYLIFFTLAVMWPSCGNLSLDCFVWFWTLSLVIEDARVAYKKYHVYVPLTSSFSHVRDSVVLFQFRSSLPFKRAVLEILAQVIFLVLYLSVRIIGLWKFGSKNITYKCTF